MLFLRHFGILILGVVVLAVGTAQIAASFAFLHAPVHLPVSFGPTAHVNAYTYLVTTTFSPPGPRVLGGAVFVAGVILIAGWLGDRVAQPAAHGGVLRRYGLLALGVLILVGCVNVVDAASSTHYGFSSLQSTGPSEVLVLAALSAGFGCIAAWIGVRVGRRFGQQAGATQKLPPS